MIAVNGITKRFKLYAKPSDRLKELVFGRCYHHTYTALDNVSFKVGKGEAVGILGKNGAGKSTLLKLLTGILLPDAGRIDIQGKVTGLLELGTGFDFNLSGLENITTNGLLLGMTPAEIRSLRDQIIAFAELEHYIKEPLRTYSSGMVMRLAFAIAIHANPDCFIVDEALSVGDAHFQQKCMRKIRRFRERGGTLVFVSHDLNAVKMICDRALVLDQGRLVADAPPEQAVNYYNRIIAKMESAEEVPSTVPGAYGSGRAEMVEWEFRGEESLTTVVSSGEICRCRLRIRAQQEIPQLTVGILIRDRFGQDIFGTNSYLLGVPLTLGPEQEVDVVFRLPMTIAPGKYTLTAALHTDENHVEECFQWCDNIVKFEVAGIKGTRFAGVCRLATTMEVIKRGRGNAEDRLKPGVVGGAH